MKVFKHSMDSVLMPSNMPSARVAACGLPHHMRMWRFDGLPSDVAISKALSWWSQWKDTMTPPGLLLSGQSGTGKTGWLASVVSALAFEGVGSRGLWNLCTAPVMTDVPLKESSRVALGELPPVWFVRWTHLQRYINAAPWQDEDDRLSFSDLIEGLHTWCSVLAVDDLSSPPDRTSRGEDLFSSLFYRVEEGMPLLLSTNILPERMAETFGERWADRLLDSKLFALRVFKHESARKRA